MAINDALASFVSSPLSLIAAAGVDVPTLPIDLFGDGVGVAVTNIWGNSTLPGSPDAHGVGSPLPLIDILIGTTPVDGTGTPTLTVELQGAEDNGSGSPGSYQTYIASATMTTAQIPTGTRIRLPFAPPFPFNDRPRFLRLNFNIPAATAYSAGTILSANVVFPRDDWSVANQSRNYTVGPLS